MGSKTNKPHNGLIFKYKIMTIIHTKTIPNLPSPNENVERKINFYGFNIDGYEDTATVPYAIAYTKDGVDISVQFEKQFKPMQWTNNQVVYQRNLQTGQPLVNPEYEEAVIANQLPIMIPNPDYIDEATTPDIEETVNNPEYIDNETLASIPEFLVAPAFSYFVEIFHAHPEIFWTFLDMYIDENYGEGWYGTQSRKVINKK